MVQVDYLLDSFIRYGSSLSGQYSSSGFCLLLACEDELVEPIVGSPVRKRIAFFAWMSILGLILHGLLLDAGFSIYSRALLSNFVAWSRDKGSGK